MTALQYTDDGFRTLMLARWKSGLFKQGLPWGVEPAAFQRWDPPLGVTIQLGIHRSQPELRFLLEGGGKPDISWRNYLNKKTDAAPVQSEQREQASQVGPRKVCIASGGMEQTEALWRLPDSMVEKKHLEPQSQALLPSVYLRCPWINKCSQEHYLFIIALRRQKPKCWSVMSKAVECGIPVTYGLPIRRNRVLIHVTAGWILTSIC